MAEKLGRPLPIPLMLVVCEKYVEDFQAARQVSLIGLLDTFVGSALPIRAPIWIVAQLTSGHGFLPLTLEICSTDGTVVVVRGESGITFENPNTPAIAAFRLSPMILPVAGDYQVRILSQGELIAERRITARLKES